MKFKFIKEIDNETYYSKYFELDKSIRLDSAIEIIKQCETPQIKMGECYCSTFSDSGSYASFVCNSLEELQDLRNRSNPRLGLTVYFIDRTTGQYQFHLRMNANSNLLVYNINKQKRAGQQKSSI